MSNLPPGLVVPIPTLPAVSIVTLSVPDILKANVDAPIHNGW